MRLPKKAADCTPGNPEKKQLPAVSDGNLCMGMADLARCSRAPRTTHGDGHAICSINGTGHGNNVVNQSPLYGAYTVDNYFNRYGQPGFSDLLLVGRDRDLNNDGLADSGGDMWTGDLFHTRDMVRQSVVTTCNSCEF